VDVGGGARHDDVGARKYRMRGSVLNKVVWAFEPTARAEKRGKERRRKMHLD